MEQAKRLGDLEPSAGAAGGLVPEQGGAVKGLRKFALPALSFIEPCKTLPSVTCILSFSFSVPGKISHHIVQPKADPSHTKV